VQKRKASLRRGSPVQPPVTYDLRLRPPTATHSPTPTYKAARPSVGAAASALLLPPLLACGAAARPLHVCTAPTTHPVSLCCRGRPSSSSRPDRQHRPGPTPSTAGEPARPERTGGPRRLTHRFSFCPNATAARLSLLPTKRPHQILPTPSPPRLCSPFSRPRTKTFAPPPDCYCRCLLPLSACLRSPRRLLRLGFSTPPRPAAARSEADAARSHGAAVPGPV
jgi:hypothetical protein